MHNWIRIPFSTHKSKIYVVHSLQDTILPWNFGNPDYQCHLNDGVKTYIKSIYF